MIAETWLPPLAGGLLIGAAAALLLVLTGRIAGISGMLRGLVLGPERGMRVLFLLGLVLGAGLMGYGQGSLPQARSGFPPVLLVLGGLLVGLGSGMARGCTSGHGVCGLARRLRRSVIAVGIFMGTAVLTTYVVRHLGGIQ